MIVRKKTQGLREVFYWERLRHWYKLFVNKWKERKALKCMKSQDYRNVKDSVIFIQKCIRGFLCRKKKVYWKKVFFHLRQKKNNERFYRLKQNLWKISEKVELDALRSTINSKFEQSGQGGRESSKLRSFNDMIFELEKNEEMETRKKILADARCKRIQALA
jgi:hypothetical protein